ncbi:MAG: S-layer homology domain-containing protein [Clostridiales bacterium]|nr:S-layer homology domain-containing protein [Clostridiales bacterium]
MAKNSKRVLSVILAFSMIFTLIPTAFAQEPENSGISYFDFEASEYEVKENAGELKIKVVRHGDGIDAADVAFKVADFLSDYGTDYEVLDEDGNALEKVYGEKPELSELEYEGEDDSVISAEDFDEEIPEDGAVDSIETAETSEDTALAEDENPEAELSFDEETASDEETQPESDESAQSSEEASLPVNTEKQSKSRGSSILDAQAEYLNLPDGVSKEETENALDETLNDMYSYFLSAEGASGKVHFAKGEKEKYITIKVIDNDYAEANKLFMIALMGTDSSETTIAANATTYVTIVDDEPLETASFDLVEDELILSSEAPTAYITVRRNSGTQYFSIVYLSTVTQTAKSSAYEGFEAKTIAFVPGETEKKVEIKAYDFSEFAQFGLRLEGDSSVEIGNHYADVWIAANDAVMMSSNDDIALMSDDISLMAANVTLGSAACRYDVELPGGWKEVRNGEGSAWNDNQKLCITQYDDSSYTMWVSHKEQNLVGVKSLTYSAYTTNPRGFGSRYQNYTTYFQTDIDQTFDGCKDEQTWNGNSKWQERTLTLKNTGDTAYIKFAGKCKAGGYHNIRAELDWVQFNYAKYTILPQNSLETFSRKIYDFTSGTPKILDTYYDGESTALYNPGSITVKNGNNTVSGFYTYLSKPITISATNKAKNEELGIYLKGVYLANGSLTDKDVFDSTKGKYKTAKLYYISADENHNVCITPDQSFLKELRDAGVIDNVHSDANIKIYPVFEQTTVTVNFENTDRNDKNPATKGKFDANNLNSYIRNIIEANKAGTVSKKVYSNWLDYYSITVPTGSIIRVETVPASNRAPQGVNWWYHDGSGSGIAYYEAGEIKYSGSSAAGDVIQETDYTKADIVATKSLSMKPATGEQTFYVGYSPLGRDFIFNVEDPENPGQKLVTTLANAVIDTSDGSMENGQKTDSDGNMWLSDPYIGKQYTLTAFAPEECYVSWANMTGDTNNDGTIGNSGDAQATSRTNRDKSANPTYIYGNKLNVTLDTDNTRYYYEFVPKTVLTTREKVGTVKREVNTLYNLSNNVKATTYTPVSGAWMNIAGFVAQTDANGSYTVKLKGLPSWGTVSTSITVGEREYFATASIEAPTNIIIPALEVFDARGVSAYYDDGGSVANNYVTVKDGTFTITASVSSDNALKPTNARFFVYSDQGVSVVDCSNNRNYKTDISSSGSKLTASLTFNPKTDMKFGYKVYVQFADQNGTWYEPIDVGYTFFSELDLGEFLFPLVGSSSLENLITTGYVADIIGDPLGDMGIGAISGFDIVPSQYTPEAAKGTEYEDYYTWQRTQYQFGWSDRYYGKMTSTSGERDEEALKNFLKDVYDGKEKGANVPTPSKYETKSKFNWSVTPAVGFNLTLSQRSDSKNYFEDMVFYVKVDFNVASQNTIALPVGINIAIDVALNGDVAGVYHMYVDYAHSFETEDAVEYTTETFGMFKTFNNNVRREGYIFLNPKVTVKLGVGVAVVYVKGSASFDFDMDFQFTEYGTNAYGDVTIDLGWSIELVGFSVYSKNLYGTTQRMFNTAGTNGHIDFDYANTAALMMLAAEDSMFTDGEFSTDEKINRDYLENRSEWLGEYGGVSLMSVDAAQGTQETVLQTGTSDNPYMSITKINDSEMLMVYVDDNCDRTDVNKRCVYYSIGDGTTWSEPKVLDNDGTLDDYPNVQDLGDDRIIVSWSSANKVHADNATVIDVLSSLEIKTAFFNKTSKTFGAVTQLTKTTEEDYTADVLPRAAYDSVTDRLILYYTKTEYTTLDDVGDLNDENSAPSVTAYLFYENGEWSNNGSAYTEAELSGMTAEEKEAYQANWYGQRFLDLRIDSASSEMLRMVESDAICYNGLSIFAWTVDWDRDLNTTDDRDVFIQIYNFEEKKFTHNIRVTHESGKYSTPKLARSNDATYLFFGVQEEGNDYGEIKYLNITDIIKNDKYTLVRNGSTEYYVLSYVRAAESGLDENGNRVDTPAENVDVDATTAVKSDNVTEYDVYVDANGQMYLFWTEVHNNARQIVASLFNGVDNEAADAVEHVPSEGENLESTYWSEAFVLTNGEENTYYSGLGASVIDGTIYVGSARGDYQDPQNTAIVIQKHTPFEKVEVTNVELENEYPAPGAAANVIVTITNKGMLQSSEPVTVYVDVNGTVVEQEYSAIIPGGASEKVMIRAALPVEAENTVIKAYSTAADVKELTVTYAPNISITDSAIQQFTDENGDTRYAFTAEAANTGNAASEAMTFKAYTGEKMIGSCTIEAIDPGMTAVVDVTLNVADSAYTITDGLGSASVEVVAENNEDTVFEYTGKVEKQFSAEAIELLSALTAVTFENNGAYTIELGDETLIQPEFEGVAKGALRVDWMTSSNGAVAYIDYSNAIISEKTGTTTITGIIVPNTETVTFSNYGVAEKMDWESVIPSDLIKTVTAKITVTEKTEENNSSGGSIPSGSGSGAAATYTVTFDTDGGTVIAPQKVEKNGYLTAFDAPEKEGYVFGGWFTDEALTERFDLSSKITSNLQLYAKWISDEKTDSTGWVNPFEDVAATDWFYSSVKYASESGLFNGISDTQFAPNAALTRAMLVTVLYRAEGQPEITGACEFTDVSEGAYYADAVAWAQANGIVDGISDESFAPDAKITREQIAAIIYRYAVYKGIKAVDSQDNLTFTDADRTSDYAVSAMNWIVGQEIINGYEDDTVRPKNNATRAEAAAVLQRFLEMLETMQTVKE